jgi:hypothetical protein
MAKSKRNYPAERGRPKGGSKSTWYRELISTRIWVGSASLQ